MSLFDYAHVNEIITLQSLMHGFDFFDVNVFLCLASFLNIRHDWLHVSFSSHSHQRCCPRSVVHLSSTTLEKEEESSPSRGPSSSLPISKNRYAATLFLRERLLRMCRPFIDLCLDICVPLSCHLHFCMFWWHFYPSLCSCLWMCMCVCMFQSWIWGLRRTFSPVMAAA